MLSVANVATLLGGTARCALDCVRALPDWEHEVIFRGGNRVKECREQFGCVVHHKRSTNDVVNHFRPDVILYHNTQPSMVPVKPPGDPTQVFYQHSPNSHSLKRKFVCRLIVSKALADRLKYPEVEVLHQPVARPTFPADFKRHERFTIGRFTTPTKSKWPKWQLNFYRRLIRPVVDRTRWEFLGAPQWFRDGLRREFPDGSFGFHSASIHAASVMHSWDALIYKGVWESYGRTICEAQQCGCIPIAHRNGGVCEQIDVGTNGFLCRSDACFSERIELLLGDQEKRLRMKIAGVKAGKARGSLDRWRNEFLKRIGIEK